MNHLEELLAEYYEWRGCVVKCNAKVGKRAKGGWEMELDVVAFDPKAMQILHVEPSLDGESWATRERRFTKKFSAGKAYILKDLFPWLPPDTPLLQRAIFPSASKGKRIIAGAEVLTVDEMVGKIRGAVKECGIASRAAISEHYPLLRTIQLVVCGYNGVQEASNSLTAQ